MQFQDTSLNRNFTKKKSYGDHTVENAKGVIHYSFLKPGETITAES